MTWKTAAVVTAALIAWAMNALLVAVACGDKADPAGHRTDEERG